MQAFSVTRACSKGLFLWYVKALARHGSRQINFSNYFSVRHYRESKKSVERMVDCLKATCNQKTKRRPGVNRLAQDSLAYQILQRMPRSWNKNVWSGILI